MAEQPDPNQTVDEPDPLDAGLAAAFGPDSGPPLPAAGSVVQALGADPVQLRTPVTEPEGPVVQPHSDALPAQAPPPLQLLGEIARGGMGAVLKGRDTDLGRDIAVKVLLETHQGKTELVQRFVEEAQIAGQLQHPGITLVYELGQFADKRPYFTMKLVKGKTLAALLTARSDPAAERTQFVGIFGQVCQTLAYAHARGVIHRDLKPANVMVGSFGEVQVMDWGLAKVLKEGGVADERQAQTHQAVSVIQTQRSAGTPEVGSHTQAGSVLGTPAYMAPEQARGEVDLVDVRADVFGLGAILCEILTGQPPFTGQRAEAQRKAQTAQLDDAFGRLAGCGADADLIDLARQCLAAEPWDRPRDAGAVAASVTACQNSVAERLRQAELAHAAEVARTEEAQATAAQERKAREAAQARAVAERQARRLTMGLAASVLALVAVGAVGGLWMQRQHAERAAEAGRQREVVEEALERVRELRQQARWPEARAVLENTRNRLGESGPKDLRQRVEQAMADQTLVDRLEDIRLKRSTVVEGKLDGRTASEDYERTFHEAGLMKNGDDLQTLVAQLRASAVCEQLVAALDDWATVTNGFEWLLEVARRADPDDWRDRFRDPKVWRDLAGLEGLVQELLDNEKQLARQKPQLLAALGSALRSTKGDAVPLLTAAQARQPDDFWLNFYLGNALYSTNKWDEAVGFYRAAAAIRPSAVAVHNNLGLALANKGQLNEAIQEYRRAIKIDPKFAYGHYNLARALKAKKQLDEAIQEYRRAIELNLNSVKYHNDLGTALYARKQVDEAIQEYRRAIEIDPKFALPHYNLGLALLQRERFVEARTATRRYLELLPESDPLRQVGSQQLQQCERLALLEGKLPALLSGQVEPANATERAAFAWYYRSKGLQTRAARLYAEAFAADPKLANDLEHAHRYYAAASAAQAAAGTNEDTKDLPDKVRVMLRRQALGWLRADLALRTQMAEREETAAKRTVQEKLQYWQRDPDLASIRDKDAVVKLPAEEREACAKLWADVAELLKKAREKSK